MLVFSLTMMAAGMATLALLEVWGGVPNVLTGLLIYGLGFGLIVAPATSAVMMAVLKDKTGDGSSVNLVSRQIGGALGVAILGSITAGIYRSGLSLEGFGLTPEQTVTVRTSLSGVMRMEKQLSAGVAAKLDAVADASMVHGLSWAMAVSAVVTLGAAALGWRLLRPREHEAATAD